MKKVKKIIFAAILSLSAVFLLVACKSKVKAADLLSSFLLEQDNTEVTANFSVQSQLKKGEETYPLTWTSSDPDHVAISAEENTENSTYDVIITRPENEEIEVTLTVKLFIKKKNQATKDFKVRLAPIDVYDFSDTFELPQKGTVVWDDFDLKTSYTVGDKTCSISWASSDENFIKINKATADVLPSTFEAPVKLLGTFSYDNKTTTKEYPLTVYYPMTQEDALIYWYEHTGITQKLEGYVVAKGTYVDKYGEGSLYVMDPSFKGGYYIYQGYIDKAEFEALELGTYVTCTGATNTSYSGLMETNYGGTIKVDTKKAKINVEEKRYAIDNDLVANVNSLYYRLSTPVSLTNWKVKEVKELDAAGSSTQTILKLEKFGVETTIAYSKYIGSTPLDAANDTFKAVVSKLGSLKEGDWVSVKGILGYYNKSNTPYDQKSYQINIESADAIVAGTEDAATTSPASKVMKQIAAINKAMEAYDAIYEKQEITLPTSSDADVTLAWGFANEYHDSAKIENGKLIVNPGVKSNIFLTATLTNGDYTTTIRYTILVENVDSQEKVNREIKNFIVNSSADATVDQVMYTGEHELPTTGSTHKDVKFTYELVGSKPENKDVVLKNNILTLPAVKEEHTITIKITATIGEGDAQKTASKEIVFYLAVPKACASVADVIKQENGTAVEFTATAVAETTRGYILYDGVTPVYMYVGSTIDKEFIMTVGQTYKVVGLKDYYNGQQVTDIISVTKQETAVPHDIPAPTEYNVEQVEKYVALDSKKYNTEYIKMTGDLSVSGNYYNLILEGTEKGQGSISYPITAYADKLKALDDCRVTVEGWLIGCSSQKYLNIVITKEPVEVVVKRTDEQAVEYIIKQLQADAKKDVTADKTLATTWEVKGNDKTPAISWKDDKDAAITSIKFEAKLESTKYALKATITVGEASKTVDITYTVPAIAKSESIADVLAKSKGDMVMVDGTVVAECAKGYVLYDGKDAIFIYAGSSITEAQKCTLNTVVTVIGKRGSYNKGPQIEYTGATVVDGATPAVLTEPVEYLGEKINEVVASSDDELKMEYVSLKGTVTTGQYYNIVVAGATNSASIYSITDAQKALLENNKVYEITGWAQSVSGGKYFNIIISEIKPAQLTDEELVDAVIADLEKDAENPIVANKALDASVTKQEKTITLAWANEAGVAITTISYTQATEAVTIPVSVTVTLNDVTKKVSLTYTIPALEKSKSIAEVLAKKQGELVQVEGTVVAVSTRGYVLWDGTDGVYVDDSTNKVEKGAVVEVTGTWDFYKDAKRVRITSVSNVKVVADATPATLPTSATEYDLAKLKEFIGKAVVVDYASFTGKVSVSGSYINIIIDGSEASETVQGSLTGTDEEMNAIKALNGLRVKFTGWLYDASSGKFPYLLLENYELLEKKTDAQAIEAIKEELTKLAQTKIKEDTTLPTTLEVGAYDGEIVISWKNGADAITAITYTSPSADTPLELVATIKAGSAAEVTHNVTFTLAGTTATDITTLVTIANGEITIPYGALKAGAGEYIIKVSDTQSIRISASNIKDQASYSEFGPDKQSNIIFTVEGCKVYTLIADTYGTFDNMKLYAAATATGTAITATTGTGTNGVLYTYNVVGGASELCFDNPSNYGVYFFSLKLVITEPVEKTDAEIVDLVVADLEKDAINQIVADKTLDASVEKEGKTVALAWTKDGAAVTSIPYVASETDQQVVVSVTLTLGEVTKTVEITYTLAALKSYTLAEALAVADGTPVKVIGTVKSVDTAWSDQYNNISVTITDGTTDLYIYRLSTKVALYDKIEITGVMETYSKKKQVAQGATATLLTKTDAEAVDEVTLWLDAFALESITANKTLPTTYTSNCNTNAATITWTFNGAAVTEVTYDATITADTEVEYIAAITLGTEQNVQHTVKFTLISANTKKATLAANVTENTDAKALTTAGTLTTSLGLDASLFTVTYDKNGASNELAVRTDGIRMYATKNSTNGNKLTITAASNVTITSIKINYDANYISTAVIYGADGTTAITGDLVGTAGTYDINGSAFTIFNNNSSVSSNTQVRFKSIEISYVVNAAA